MNSMFYGAKSFNQPIGNWNVSSVTRMTRMFNGANTFNQDISNWCVKNISSEPSDFSSLSPLQESYKPKWGQGCSTLSNTEFTNFEKETNIYPNPTNDILNISIADFTQAQVYDVTGRLIKNITIVGQQISLAGLSSGNYILQLQGNNNSQTFKIVKQ